jgi:hypothetical protein
MDTLRAARRVGYSREYRQWMAGAVDGVIERRVRVAC